MSSLFSANIVWGQESLFDEECIAQSIDMHTQLYGKKFPSEFIDKLSALAYGDPTTVKRIVMQAIGDPAYMDKFITTEDPTRLYELVGEDWFGHRYSTLTDSLTRDSVERLINKDYGSSSDYVVNTGLVVMRGEEGMYTVLNPFFEYHLSVVAEDLLNNYQTTKNRALHPSDYLSGQELIAFTLFKKHEEEIVSKDLLAEVIWGEDWEEKYSDWAIDKLVSNIRKKLSKHDYPQQLKTIRGRGVMLS